VYNNDTDLYIYMFKFPYDDPALVTIMKLKLRKLDFISDWHATDFIRIITTFSELRLTDGSSFTEQTVRVKSNYFSLEF
jgi:hypothetical protein